jgi:hypothetical protein
MISKKFETITFPTLTYRDFRIWLQEAADDIWTIHDYFPVRIYEMEDLVYPNPNEPPPEDPNDLERYYLECYAIIEVHKSRQYIRQQCTEWHMVDSGVDRGESIPEQDPFWNRPVAIFRVYNVPGRKPGIVVRAFDCGEPNYFRDLLALVREPIDLTVLNTAGKETTANSGWASKPRHGHTEWARREVHSRRRKKTDPALFEHWKRLGGNAVSVLDDPKDNLRKLLRDEPKWSDKEIDQWVAEREKEIKTGI